MGGYRVRMVKDPKPGPLLDGANIHFVYGWRREATLCRRFGFRPDEFVPEFWHFLNAFDSEMAEQRRHPDEGRGVLTRPTRGREK